MVLKKEVAKERGKQREKKVSLVYQSSSRTRIQPPKKKGKKSRTALINLKDNSAKEATRRWAKKNSSVCAYTNENGGRKQAAEPKYDCDEYLKGGKNDLGGVNQRKHGKYPDRDVPGVAKKVAAERRTRDA